MNRITRKLKKGVASFYIVAFSTLILVITVASFATVVVSEIARTSNDDLSQSAYDAALAGIEDAKLAYTNYQACLEQGKAAATGMNNDGVISCEEIIYLVKNPNCDMVARMLGRIPDDGEYSENSSDNEILISETTGAKNGMNQAYTCVKIDTTVQDYRATLSSSNSYKVVKVNLKDVSASDIKSVKFSWYSNKQGEIYTYSNFKTDRVVFGSLLDQNIKVATPPTVELGLIQTAEDFTMEQLNGQTDVSGNTDRATLYLVPSNNSSLTESKYHKSAYKNGVNSITAEQVAETNNLQKNLPYAVFCKENGGSDFACSVEIELPNPIPMGENIARNGDTFMFVVSLPYERPETDFVMEFICKEGKTCGDGAGGEAGGSKIAGLENMQVSIDSTGRANDLFRRVEVRMEVTDSSFSYPLYAIQTVKKSNGNTNDGGIVKNFSPTSEYGVFEDGEESYVGGGSSGEPSGETIADVACMQDFAGMSGSRKAAILESMPYGTTYTLKDCRDNTEYHIARLRDDNVWMQDNLALDLSNSSVLNGLTANNTNADNASLISLKSGNRETGAQYATSGYSNGDGWTASYKVPKANASYKNYITLKPYGGNGNGKIGVYYNYCAASAGSYCYDEGAGVGKASYDICPKGWHMFSDPWYVSEALRSPYLSISGGTSMYASDLSLSLTGRIVESSGFQDVRKNGYWWTSERKDEKEMYYVFQRTYRITGYGHFERKDGLPIRCVMSKS